MCKSLTTKKINKKQFCVFSIYTNKFDSKHDRNFNELRKKKNTIITAVVKHGFYCYRI